MPEYLNLVLISDKVWLCETCKNVHEESGDGTTVQRDDGEGFILGLYAAARSQICLQNSSGLFNLFRWLIDRIPSHP